MGKFFIFIDCLYVGALAGIWVSKSFFWHPLFCILAAIVVMCIIYVGLTSSNIIGWILQFGFGAIWGYIIASIILGFMDNPDSIWTWGIRIISIIICIGAHLAVTQDYDYED